MADELAPHVRLLRDFTNTNDYETAEDLLKVPADLANWYAERGLLTEDVAVRPRDLADARRLREGLRAAMGSHHDGPDMAASGLDALLASVPLRLTLGQAGPRLEPVHTGARGALARIVLAIADAAADGSWWRLKVCPADDCRWAFFDASKNHSRTWCSMRVCGNREKTRTYRSRHRAG